MENRGDSNRITREYFDSILLEARYWDSDLPSTAVTLFGKTFETPIATAALSHLDNVCPGGAVKMAAGAATVKIIKPLEDDRAIFAKIEHACRAGATAVGMDIDHAFSASGGYDNVLGLQMHAKTSAQLREYVQASTLPFVVKGVLSVRDAEICMEAGVGGIVVSHHHGIMPSAVPPLMLLPEIVKVTDHRIPVFVDCGVESGVDAFKALALGADAVCVGRHLMRYLKDEGGVGARIREMTGELCSVMARTGAKSPREIDPAVLHFRAF